MLPTGGKYICICISNFGIYIILMLIISSFQSSGNGTLLQNVREKREKIGGKKTLQKSQHMQIPWKMKTNSWTVG
jgi:hypothetical protein